MNSFKKLYRYLLLRQLVWQQERAHTGHRLCVPTHDWVGQNVSVYQYFEKAEIAWVTEHILQPLKRAHGSVYLLDIGANIGNHTLYWSDYCDQIFSYEPHPVTFLLLQANLLHNGCRRVLPFNCALSDTTDVIQLQAEKFASLGASEILNNPGSNAPYDTERHHLFEVQAFSGDAREEIQRLAQLDVIKIDVEGAESLVLKGLQDTLGKHKPILIYEVNTAEQMQDVQALLAGAGYQNFYCLDAELDLPRNKFLRILERWRRLEKTKLHKLPALFERPYPFCLALTDEKQALLKLEMLI